MKKSFEIVQTPFGNFLINEHDYIGNHIKKNENWENHLYHFYSEKNQIIFSAIQQVESVLISNPVLHFVTVYPYSLHFWVSS